MVLLTERRAGYPAAIECAYHPGVPAIGHCSECGCALCADCLLSGKGAGTELCAQCMKANHARPRKLQHRRRQIDWRRLLHGMAVAATFIVAAGVLAFLFLSAWDTAKTERTVTGIADRSPDEAEIAEMRGRAIEAIGSGRPEPAAGDFPAIAERVMRSVVLISTGRIVEGRGSGFVVTSQGDVLTAAHVIQGDRRPRVTFPDGRSFRGTVLLEDSRTDVALLRVDYRGAPPLALGSSEHLSIGTGVAVLGYPLSQSFEALGFRAATPTLVQGIVAARQAHRPTPLSQPVQLLQIDANLNPGHSGGPVFLRSTGEVVGIANSTIHDVVSGKTDVCFAVPIDVALAAIGRR